MRILYIIFINVFFYFQVSGQKTYWQQQISYDIDVDFNHQNHQFNLTEKITYYNNSPDNLNKVFFHLYYNAFQPGSMMDVRSRTIADPDSRVLDRIQKLNKDEIGFQKINSVVDGNNKNLIFNEQGTILEVILDKPLNPGKKLKLTLSCRSQIPLQIRRTGRYNKENVAYSMTQWYPKMCEYDDEGWHSNPYIGREFHGVWGDFDVTIKIDKDFIVAASGYLQESDPSNLKLGKRSGNKRIWNFLAPKVHDFTWAADPDYIHDIFDGPNGVKLNFYYKNDPKIIDNWKTLQPVTAELMKFFNENIGIYPYRQYSVVQGGDGGMEYSMLTLINSGEDLIPLVSVTSHELAHAWFQGVLATNEMKHAWMDEGSASYFGELGESHVFNIDFHPFYTRSPYRDYISLAKSGQEMPLATNANRFKYNRAYEDAAYDKGFVFLSQLKYIIGDDEFKRTIKNYFDTYKFTHPLPDDLRRIAEQTSGILLNWYLTDWTNTTNKINYAIDKVEQTNGKSKVTIERIGLMPMPLEVLVKYKDGTEEYYYIPISLMRGEKKQPIYAKNWRQIKDWSWAYKKYSFEIESELDSIESIDINPTGLIADTDNSNNIVRFD